MNNLTQNERYIQALKKGQKDEAVEGNSDYDESEEGKEDNDNNFDYGHKIFFTEGGHTNKVNFNYSLLILEL